MMTKPPIYIVAYQITGCNDPDIIHGYTDVKEDAIAMVERLGKGYYWDEVTYTGDVETFVYNNFEGDK